MKRERSPVPIQWPTPDGAPRPKPGDLMLGCAHARNAHGRVGAGLHILHVFDGGISYERDDGTKGTAQWIGLCDACFRLYGERPFECPFTTDAILSPEGLLS